MSPRNNPIAILGMKSVVAVIMVQSRGNEGIVAMILSPKPCTIIVLFFMMGDDKGSRKA